MNAQLAIPYIEHRAKQLGFASFDLRFRDIALKGMEQRQIGDHTEMFLVIESDREVGITSDSGKYNKSNAAYAEHEHEHIGPILLKNNASTAKNITLLQVFWKR